MKEDIEWEREQILHKTSKWGVGLEVDFCDLKEKEEEGHFGDIDVTQNIRIQGAKREGGQGLRYQMISLVPTGSEIGTTMGLKETQTPQKEACQSWKETRDHLAQNKGQ